MYKFFKKNKKNISIILFVAIVFSIFPIAGQIQTSAADSSLVSYIWNMKSNSSNTSYWESNQSSGINYTGTLYFFVIYKATESGTITLNISNNYYKSLSVNGSTDYVYQQAGSKTDIGLITKVQVYPLSPNTGEVVEVVASYNLNDGNQYCIDKCNELNVSSDYASFLRTYTYNGVTNPYNAYASNAGIQLSTELYIDQYTFITYEGAAAMTGGISTYELYINDTLQTPQNLTMLSDDLFGSYITDNNLDITDYINNSQFSITIDLTNYIGEDLAIRIVSRSVYDNSALIVYAVNIHAYPDPDEPGSDTETESESEPEDTETESTSEIIPPEVDPEDTVIYQQGYAAGYEAASKLAQSGVFKDGQLAVYYNISARDKSSGLTNSFNAEYWLTPDIGQSYVNLHNVYTWYNRQYPDTVNIDYTLNNVRILFHFGTAFRYQPDLIKLKGIIMSGYDSYLKPQVFLYDEQYKAYDTTLAYPSDTSYSTTIGVNTTNTYEGLVQAIEINLATEPSFNFWYDVYRMQIYVSPDQIVTDLAAYNKGLAIGKDVGSKLGFDQGYKEGLKAPTDKAFSDGRTEGYEEGFKAGVLEEQSNELRQEFKFYDLFFSIFDSMSNVFQSIASFEIFGVNVAGFVFGLVTIGVIAFVIRKVW